MSTAKATLIPAKVETKTVEVAPAKVVLELDLEAAETLAIIQRHVGGSPDGLRGHMESIGKALRGAGVDWKKHAVLDPRGGFYTTSHLFEGTLASLVFKD